MDRQESGVPAEAPDGAAQTDVLNGYGRELIGQALPYQLSTEVNDDLGAQGVRCRTTIPLSSSMDVAQTPASEIHD